MDPASIIIIFAIGTATGGYMAYKLGAKVGADLAIKILIDNKYLRYQTNKQGEIELLPYKKEATIS